MRVIKFRAWSKDTKEMVPWDEFNSEYLYLPEDWDVENMQFTGLMDKNEVEIYEGDIIHYYGWGIPITCKIIWNENISAFQLSYPNVDNHWVSDTLYTHKRKQYEVIGNIYQNSELLLI